MLLVWVGVRLQEWLGFRLQQTKDVPSVESAFSISIRKVHPVVGPVWEVLPGCGLSETGP